MGRSFLIGPRQLRIATIVACFLAAGQLAQAVEWGQMKADRILFLGNSITLHGPYNNWSATANWGMAASEASKDYVHLLTSRINATTGGSMTVAPPDPMPGRWYSGDPLPKYVGNVLNIADVFERNFNTWDNARIQNQLDTKPDIVVLQFGENMQGGTPEQFKSAFQDLLNALKNESNPHIFVTSFVSGSTAPFDQIKQQVCAEDPSRRVFVNLTGVDMSGIAGHPADAGMKTIADTLFTAMESHAAVPEPSALTMVLAAGLSIGALAWRRRGRESVRLKQHDS